MEDAVTARRWLAAFVLLAALPAAAAPFTVRLGSERVLRVDFEGPAPRELPDGVVEEERGPERLVLRFERDRIPSARLVEWLSERCPIADLSLEEPPIERIVAEIYRRGLPPGDG